MTGTHRSDESYDGAPTDGSEQRSDIEAYDGTGTAVVPQVGDADERATEGSDVSHVHDADHVEGSDASRAEGSDANYAEGSDVTTVGTGAEMVATEERLEVGTTVQEVGEVHVRKQVESHPVEYSVPRDVEHVDTNERIAAEEGDSGEVEVLDDGSVSIPVFEEVLVVTKRLVVRERVIVRKRTVVDEYKLQTDLRRQNVTVDVDDSVRLIDDKTSEGHLDSDVADHDTSRS